MTIYVFVPAVVSFWRKRWSRDDTRLHCAVCLQSRQQSTATCKHSNGGQWFVNFFLFRRSHIQCSRQRYGSGDNRLVVCMQKLSYLTSRWRRLRDNKKTTWRRLQLHMWADRCTTLYSMLFPVFHYQFCQSLIQSVWKVLVMGAVQWALNAGQLAAAPLGLYAPVQYIKANRKVKLPLLA